MAMWNLWHGCTKISAGCKNCYVYRRDESIGVDSRILRKTSSFNLPIEKNRAGEYKIPSGSLVSTCFTSDFFHEDADSWRPDAWAMMRLRSDLNFLMLTKRIHRFTVALPEDWGDGYDNVHVWCTVENQKMADYRLPIFRALPIKHKGIACAPLLGPIDISSQLGSWLEGVSLGGESGPNARVCDYEWVLDIRNQCARAGVPFQYHQTGARLLKDGRLYRIPRKMQHSQAHRAGIDWRP